MALDPQRREHAPRVLGRRIGEDSFSNADSTEQQVKLSVQRQERLQRQVVDVGQVVLGIDRMVSLQAAQRRPVVNEVLPAQVHRFDQLDAEQLLNVLGDARV